MPPTDYEMMVDLYESVGQPGAAITQADTAHLVIQENKVLGAATVPGLHVEPEPTDSGVRVRLRLDPGDEFAHTWASALFTFGPTLAWAISDRFWLNILGMVGFCPEQKHFTSESEQRDIFTSSLVSWHIHLGGLIFF